MKREDRKNKSLSGSPRAAEKLLADVLICHGKDLELVRDLMEFGQSIGLKASNVTNLQSNNLPQNDRVEYAIKHSDLIIIVASFNEDEPQSTNARPNVYDELRTAVMLKPRDTLVLQEENDQGGKVVIQSNLDGHCVIIPFNRKRLHKLYTSLLKEFSTRYGFGGNNRLAEKMRSGDILNRFLDEMDNIWEEQFDKASNEIVKDWETENKFQNLLDKFFQKYWDVFDALIRQNADLEKLKSVCHQSIKESVSLATEAWQAVVDGKSRHVEELAKKNSRSKNIGEITKRRTRAFELTRKRSDMPDEKMKDYREALEELKVCISLF